MREKRTAEILKRIDAENKGLKLEDLFSWNFNSNAPENTGLKLDSLPIELLQYIIQQTESSPAQLIQISFVCKAFYQACYTENVCRNYLPSEIRGTDHWTNGIRYSLSNHKFNMRNQEQAILKQAAKIGNLEYMQWLANKLLQNGVMLDTPEKTNFIEELFAIAKQHGHAHILNWLVWLKQPNELEHDKLKLFLYAVKRNHLATVEWCWDNGSADLRSEIEDRINRAILTALKRGNIAVINWLWNKANPQIKNEIENNANSLIIKVSKLGQRESIEWFLENNILIANDELYIDIMNTFWYWPESTLQNMTMWISENNLTELERKTQLYDKGYYMMYQKLMHIKPVETSYAISFIKCLSTIFNKRYIKMMLSYFNCTYIVSNMLNTRNSKLLRFLQQLSIEYSNEYFQKSFNSSLSDRCYNDYQNILLWLCENSIPEFIINISPEAIDQIFYYGRLDILKYIAPILVNSGNEKKLMETLIAMQHEYSIPTSYFPKGIDIHARYMKTFQWSWEQLSQAGKKAMVELAKFYYMFRRSYNEKLPEEARLLMLSEVPPDLPLITLVPGNMFMFREVIEGILKRNEIKLLKFFWDRSGSGYTRMDLVEYILKFLKNVIEDKYLPLLKFIWELYDSISYDAIIIGSKPLIDSSYRKPAENSYVARLGIGLSSFASEDGFHYALANKQFEAAKFLLSKCLDKKEILNYIKYRNTYKGRFKVYDSEYKLKALPVEAIVFLMENFSKSRHMEILTMAEEIKLYLQNQCSYIEGRLERKKIYSSRIEESKRTIEYFQELIQGYENIDLRNDYAKQNSKSNCLMM